MCGQLNCIVNLNRRFCKQQRRNCLNSRKYARLKLKVNLDNSYCIGAAKLFMKKNIYYMFALGRNGLPHGKRALQNVTIITFIFFFHFFVQLGWK